MENSNLNAGAKQGESHVGYTATEMHVAQENPGFNRDDVRAVAALRSSLIAKRDEESKGKIRVLVACRNASGSSDMALFDVHASQSQIDLGEHYDLAEEMASEAGFEAPFVCFDPTEVGALKTAIEAYGVNG